MFRYLAITDNGARLDIAAYGFWGGRFEKAFLELRVSVYRRHEHEKRQYEQQVQEVEHSTFTSLVLSTTGEMGRAATAFFKRLASLLSENRNVSYSKTMGWIRCCLSFALLRASIMSSTSHLASEGLQEPFDLQLAVH